MTLEAVLFDVDFTLVRPGPELGPQGYVRAGGRHGLTLDPDRYDDARLAALVGLKRNPNLEHDDEIWVAFTERIVLGMGGTQPQSRRMGWHTASHLSWDSRLGGAAQVPRLDDAPQARAVRWRATPALCGAS